MNAILAMMRDDDIAHDPWGTAMAWGFAVCDVLYDADPNEVPAYMEYRPGLGGSEVPTSADKPEVHRFALMDVPYETGQVWGYLHNTDAQYADDLPYWDDPTFAGRVCELRYAARCLHRYLALCKAAGRDY